jgi:ferredoxin-NADP reductase
MITQTPETKHFQAIAVSVASTLKRASVHPWATAFVRPETWNGALKSLNPMLSLGEVRARVIQITDETSDTKTFVLRPNVFWQQAKAGQFVRVGVEINGRLTERIYSLSSAPGDKFLSITVKRKKQGHFSNALHDSLKVGDVVSLSHAEGEFILPPLIPQKVLLLSAGSGITPVMSILKELAAQQPHTDVVHLHICKNEEDFIFARSLLKLAEAMPSLLLLPHFTQNSGRFPAKSLKTLLPDIGERSTWLCGPENLMKDVHDLWKAEGYKSPLYSEKFAATLLSPATPASPATVTFAKSCKTFLTQSSAPLLVQAEEAGLSPKHGCRIGICATCQCIKKSGTVENLQTGKVSSAPNELIRICVSVARSNVELHL